MATQDRPPYLELLPLNTCHLPVVLLSLLREVWKRFPFGLVYSVEKVVLLLFYTELAHLPLVDEPHLPHHHVRCLLQVTALCVHDVHVVLLAALYAVLLDQLAALLKEIRWDIVDCLAAREPQVDVCRRKSINVKPSQIEQPCVSSWNAGDV
jgi:hypothetical protein